MHGIPHHKMSSMSMHDHLSCEHIREQDQDITALSAQMCSAWHVPSLPGTGTLCCPRLESHNTNNLINSKIYPEDSTYHTRSASLLVYLVSQQHEWEVLPVSRVSLHVAIMVNTMKVADCRSLQNRRVAESTCDRNSSRQFSRLSNVFWALTSYTRTQQSAPL